MFYYRKVTEFVKKEIGDTLKTKTLMFTSGFPFVTLLGLLHEPLVFVQSKHRNPSLALQDKDFCL